MQTSLLTHLVLHRDEPRLIPELAAAIDGLKLDDTHRALMHLMAVQDQSSRHLAQELGLEESDVLRELGALGRMGYVSSSGFQRGYGLSPRWIERIGLATGGRV